MGTPNPGVGIREQNSNLTTVNETGEGTVLKIGGGSANLRGIPVRCGSLGTVNLFGVGPGVGSAGAHIEHSGRPCFFVQADTSIPGTFGPVSKKPVGSPASPSTMALSAASFNARSDGNPLPSGAALDVESGWVDPPSPLPGKLVVGGGGAAHIVTWSYFNEAQERVDEIITVASGGGTYTTAGRVKTNISYVTNVSPGDITTLSFNYAGPLERLDGLLFRCVAGGQVSTSGAVRPLMQYSFDNGVTFSPSFPLPSTGVMDLYSYPGSLLRWHTGVRATFTQGTVARTLWGAVRVPGATVNGDTVWTLAAAGVTVAVVDAGAGPVFTVVAGAVTLTTPVATTTANALAAFFASDTSPGTLAARALVYRVSVVGSGAGFMAVAAGTGAPNGGIVWTGKAADLRVRVLVSGFSTVEDLQFAGSDLTVVSATDANGAQTSTATSVVTRLASGPYAAIAALFTAVVTGTGGGIIGSWDPQALPVAVASGDQWLSYTTPPMASLADFQVVWDVLRTKYKKTLEAIECIHLVQDNIDNITFQAFRAWLQSVKDGKKIPLWGFVQGLYRAPSFTTDQQWANAFIAGLPTPRNTLVSLHGGRVDTLVSVYGCQQALNNATVTVARGMNCIISQSPSQVRCLVRSSDGVQEALPGTSTHLVAIGSQEQVAIWEDDDSLLLLHNQNVTTLYTVPKKDGVFLRQSLIFCDDGDPMVFWERRRVMNRAFNRTYASLVPRVNSNLLCNNDGTLAEIDAQQIEKEVMGDLKSGGLVNDGGKDHVSSFSFAVSRFEVTLVTLNVDTTLSIVPLGKAVTISETIGYTRSIGGQ